VNLTRQTLSKPLNEPYEHSYQQNYKSNVSWQTPGTINQTTLKAKQSERQLPDAHLPDGKEVIGKYRIEEVVQRHGPLALAKTPAVKP